MRRARVVVWYGAGVLTLACSLNQQLDTLKGEESRDAGASAGTGGVGAAGSGGSGAIGAGSAGIGAAGQGTGGGFPGTLPNGALCTADGGCVSGHCSNGVCCDTACAGPCMACVAAAKESGETDGECGPAKSGTDPRGDCSTDAPESCGDTGKCDGTGACQKYPAGTQCSSSTCSGGVKTLPKLCDGSGQCVAAGTENCNPKVCNGDVCSSDCVGDSSCSTGEYCDTLTGNCTTKLAKGQNCQAANQCSTGFCVDGSCCESACTGSCMACNGALTIAQSGTCAAVTAGTDPDNNCADQGASSCGTDGKCDGSGKCRKYGPTAVCAAATCSGSTQTNAKTCDGNGVCSSNGTTNCSPYVCSGSQCGASCSGSTGCVSGSFCTSGTCQGQKSNGATCGSAQECTSGFCVDGVCCNSTCTGNCQACSAAAKGTGANGTCANVAAGKDPHNNCTQQAASTCGTDGTCNGSGGCRLWPSGTVCSSASCALDPANNFTYLQTNADTCDGAGTCVDKGTVGCGLLTCDGDVCRTSCTSTTQCVLGDCVSGTCYFNPF